MNKIFSIAALFISIALLISRTDITEIESGVNSYDDASYLQPEKLQANRWMNTAMMPCPELEQNYYLADGQCEVIIDNFGFMLPEVLVEEISFNNSQDGTSIEGTTYCPIGQTIYRRKFENTSPTDVVIHSVFLGVYESSNAPIVGIRFYDESLTLLSTQNFVMPDLTETIHQFALSNSVLISANEDYYMEVVVNAPVVSIFKLAANSFGDVIGTDPTLVTAANCTPSSFISEFTGSEVTLDSYLFGAIGIPDSYKFTNNSNDLYEGDSFVAGTYLMDFTIVNANGDLFECSEFTINVIPFTIASGSLACSGEVNVSIDDDCVVKVTPDMLLEGAGYGCYDNYTIDILNPNGTSRGDTLTVADVGKTYTVKVTGPNGNSCWSTLKVEDKIGPQLSCGNIYTTCSSDLTPGALLSSRIPYNAQILNGNIGPDVSSKSFIVSVNGVPTSTITDVNVFLDIEHARVSDLSATITSPDGVTVPLFLNLACSGSGFMATLDDQATSLYGQLVSACEPTVPAISGTYRPNQSMSVFNGKPLSGDWTITVFDNVTGEAGVVKHVNIVFSQVGARMPFPVDGNVVANNLGNNTFSVLGADNCLQATMQYSDEIVEQDCSTEFSKVIKRCWESTDALGNRGDNCCQFIYVYRNGVSTLVFPPHYDGLGGNPGPLSCLTYGTTKPPVSVTGVPTGDLCDNVQFFDPIDIQIDICEGSYKLIRTHRVLEWCSGQVLIYNQIIKVGDTDGPRLTCPSNVTINTEDNSCLGRYIAPLPGVTRECSSPNALTYILTHSASSATEGFTNANVNQNTRMITNLPLGTSWIKWDVIDNCGNTSSCVFTITVEDKIRPIAVCDRITVTSLGIDGFAVVNALTFDDGSHDNCDIDKLEVRKMSDVCNLGGTTFGSEVKFCCLEVGSTIMVEMRVTDVHNNTNTCMVEVTVQDKLPPVIVKCAPDVTIDCTDNPDDLTLTKEPEYIDNCPGAEVKYQDFKQINQCGNGSIRRTWTVTDKQGWTASCVQIITIRDSKPFFYNINDRNDRRNDIVWPQDYVTTVCGSSLLPNALPKANSAPELRDDNCSLVAAHYKDQTFIIEKGVCEKILRKWTVIDWCTYNDVNPVYGQGWYEHIQIIKLENRVPPSISTCIPRTIDVFEDCRGLVEFTMDATDDCPQDNTNIDWTYRLFTNTGTLISPVGNTKEFRRTLAIGDYIVKWTATDKCGNIDTCSHVLTVRDGKKPTPYCITQLTSAVMNSDSMIEVWARDFDKGSFDNCTRPENLIFTFFGARPDPRQITNDHYFEGNGMPSNINRYRQGFAQRWLHASKTSGKIFTCRDIPDGISHEVSLDITVFDEAGNSDYCTVKYNIQDNSNLCPDQLQNMAVVQGRISLSSVGMENAEVIAQSAYPSYRSTVYTDIYGNFLLDNLPKNRQYTLNVAYDKDITNGVSTLDLVHIQRHILNLKKFTSPYQIIAADADNNERITAADLSNIRKVILGVSNSFGNNQQSWRFINAQERFSNPDNPFPFVENYLYDNLQQNMLDQNFIPVKIGDVNNSAVMNIADQKVEARSGKSIVLFTNDAIANENEEVIVPIFCKNFYGISGIQFTLEFNPLQLLFSDIEPGALPVGLDNFGIHRTKEGLITVSWNDTEDKFFNNDQPLFFLKFKSLERLNGQPNLNVSSAITKSVAYDANDLSYDISWASNRAMDGFVVYQNQPNPFVQQSIIGVEGVKNTIIKITYTDITGGVLAVRDYPITKGYNEILVDADDLNLNGVVLYRIESGEHSISNKMIILK